MSASDIEENLKDIQLYLQEADHYIVCIVVEVYD